MATFSRIKVWVSNEVLTAADLNAEFDNIITNMAPLGIEDASQNVAAMQSSVSPGGLGSESPATSLLGELQRLRYVIQRIVKLDLTKFWYETPIADLSAGGIPTAALADGSVTRVKQEALGPQVATVVSFSTNSGSFVDVTGLTVNITTSGRPVVCQLVPDAASGSIDIQDSSDIAGGIIRILRGISSVGVFPITINTTGVSNSYIELPPSFVNTLDINGLGAGTYTYKVQALTISGTINFDNVSFVVYET